MNALLQEIVKYKGSNLSIKFIQQNNWPGFLFSVFIIKKH